MKTNWEEIAFIKASKYRKQILDSLSEPKTPTELAKITGQNISHISRTLKELQERELIKCLTPNLRKGRLYKKL
ncbi:MAG: ArsR family transcriptional regulator [archaeon]|jgi:predicted transcriptional regulator